jgi:general secretion pathway protein L
VACRIQFVDFELSRFRWLRTLANTESESGEADSSELRNICAKAGPVTVFLPQHAILLTQAMLPPRASKQQLNAIAFAIEDQLADDIDDDFFALMPQQPDGSVPVAVLARDLMDRLSALLAEQHVQARHVLPESYLCPVSTEETWLATVCPLADGYLVRYGIHAGFYCCASLLPQSLYLLKSKASESRVRVDFFGDDLPAELEQGDLECRQLSRLELLAAPLELSACINLKQKEYQSSHAWLGVIRRWRWPIGAAAVLALVYLGSGALDIWRMDKQYQALIEQQRALLKAHVADITPGSRPKDQLVKLLSSNRSLDQQAGFLDLLHEYTRLKDGLQTISTSKILFQQSRLVVSVESKELKGLDELREKLANSQYSASVENVNIKPDETTARVILGGAE